MNMQYRVFIFRSEDETGGTAYIEHSEIYCGSCMAAHDIATVMNAWYGEYSLYPAGAFSCYLDDAGRWVPEDMFMGYVRKTFKEFHKGYYEAAS